MKTKTMMTLSKRLLALALCGCALLSAAACKKNGDGDADIAAKRASKLVALENVYLTKYIDTSDMFSDGTNVDINNIYNYGDNAYFEGYYNRQVQIDEENQSWESGRIAAKIDIDSGKCEALAVFPDENNEDKYAESDPNATSATNEYIDRIFVAPDETVWYILNTNFMDWSDPENYIHKNSFTIIHIDKDKNELSSTSLDSCFGENEYAYISSIFYDSNSEAIVLNSESKLIFVSETGEIINTVETNSQSGEENIYSTVIMDNGDIVVLTIKWDDGGSGGPTRKLKKLDIESGKFTDYADIEEDIYNMYAGVGNSIYYTGETGVFSYNIDTAESKEVLNFINSDINSNRMNIRGSIGGDKFIATEYTKNWENQRLALLTKAAEGDIVEKYTMDFASVYLDDNLKDAIIEFNKQSEDCRINYIDYSKYNTDDDYEAGIKQLNQDIIKGNIPDLFNAAELPLENYTSKSLIADLSQYMNEDADFDKSKYFENILNITAEDGKIYSLIPSFNLTMLVGDKEYFNGNIKISMDDLINLKKKYPESSLFEYYVTRGELLTGSYGAPIISAFAAANNGNGDFNSGEFAKYLELIKDVQEEFNWDEYYQNNPDAYDDSTMYLEKRVLLQMQYLGNVRSLRYMKRSHGDNYAFAGFPVPDENSNGIFVSPQCEIAVSAKSVMKKEAWDFMKYLLDEEYQKNTYGMPLMKSVFDDAAESFIKEEEERKARDEQADKNNGGAGDGSMEVLPMPRAAVSDSVIIGGSGGMQQARIYVTQDDVDKVYELIESADSVVRRDDEINKIIEEEAGAYFAGKKSVNDVANIIQSRVEIYNSENK